MSGQIGLEIADAPTEAGEVSIQTDASSAVTGGPPVAWAAA